MSKEDYLKTVWGAACARLGYPVCNAYFYREEGVPKKVTDAQITAQAEIILEEMANPPASVDPVPAPAPVTP
jgi:hypothetical protein